MELVIMADDSYDRSMDKTLWQRIHTFLSLKDVILFIAGLIVAAAWPAWPASAQQEITDEATLGRIEAYRKWVKQVDEFDYFFWRRYFDREANNWSEFPQPDAWYNPSALIEGSGGDALPRTPSNERLIDDALWQSLVDWAEPRKTGTMLVMRGSQIEREYYADGYHPGSLVAVRSFTKILPALLTGIAIKEGHMKSLDDAVGLYLEEWRDDPRGEITLRQLLTGTSGLEWVFFNRDPDNKMLRLAEGSDVNEVALSYRKDRESGSRWTINNADSQIAALAVARAVGTPFDKYLGEKLWRPLGAGAATLNLDGLDGDVRGFCCMRARLTDWLRVGRMVMDDGAWRGEQIIPADFIREMRKTTSANPHYGVALWNGYDDTSMPLRSEENIPLSLKHSETLRSENVHYLVGGLSVLMWMMPEEDLVVIRWGEDPDDWDNVFIPNTLHDALEAK